MRIRIALTTAAMLAPMALTASTAAFAEITTDTVRQRAEQACYDDATRLCNDAIPDEAKITACMARNRSKLSPGCRKIFDAGTR